MTPAEFDTRRRYLGLSVDQTATLCGVADRTVRRWQYGVNPIPDDVPAAFGTIEMKMWDIVDEALSRARHGTPVKLIRYRDEDEIPGGLPHGAHAMAIAWTAIDLKVAGHDPLIVWHASTA